MNIALIRRSYRVDGGAETMLRNILSALGSEISLTVLAEKWPENLRPNHRVEHLRAKGLTRTARQASFVRAVQTHLKTNHYDLVQSHERVPGVHIYRAGDGVHRAWLNIRCKMRGFPEHLSQALSPFHQLLLKQEKELFEHDDLRAVICNSEMVRQEILGHYNVAPQKLRVIRNGVNVNKFRPAEPDARRKLKSQLVMEGKFWAIFCGSGFERKGLDILLQAMALSKTPWRLLVLGADKSTKRYQKMALRLGLSNRVRFAGAVTNVVDFYQAADLNIHPAWYDPMPNASLEAMACGLGVITTDGCGTSELLIDKGGCVVPRGDVTSLSAALDKATEQSEQWGKEARHIAEKLSLEHLRNELVQLYEELLYTT